MAAHAENLKSARQSDTEQPRFPFTPRDRANIEQTIDLPDELWLLQWQCPCTFPSSIFSGVMLNLIKNPNITSSHLFRADILYDSDQDHQHDTSETDGFDKGFSRRMNADDPPKQLRWPGFHLTRTIVRRLIPRNVRLDRPMVQTCHYFSRRDDEIKEQTLVVYMPHVEKPADMPFYHPAVSQLAFLHTWQGGGPPSDDQAPATFSLLYRLFPSHEISVKLERTALKLMQTIHKHGQGQLLGYEKRVHLDQIISQKRYQDTYAHLKAKYGRRLSEKWVEVTDPGKHVFEDIAISAYLIELWKDMYQLPNQAPTDRNHDRPPFPGFVDMGCGNGLLTFLLLSEGYPGYGFDARKRKTWSVFPPAIQSSLHQKILVPSIFQEATTTTTTPSHDDAWTDGIFFPPGAFVISNHADELTAWTPLLAHLNSSSFIAIPCCSHDLSGARFRAPSHTKASKDERIASRLPQQDSPRPSGQAAERGSLARTEQQKKMPSAYSSLCSYVTSLAEQVGFTPEQDTLRIPSTRNACIVGRRRRGLLPSEDGPDDRKQKVVDLVEAELKKPMSRVAADWIERATKLLQKPGSGH